MVICLIVGALAAYVLARYRVRVTRILLMLVLMTQMFPLVVLVIPLFVTMRKAGLLGTYWSLIITYLAFSVPLAIWVMRGFILVDPGGARARGADRRRDALRRDGPGRPAAGRARPGGDRGAALPGGLEGVPARADVHQRGGRARPLPLVLQTFVGRGDTDWGAVMATSVLYTLPVVIVFVLAAQAPDDAPGPQGR